MSLRGKGKKRGSAKKMRRSAAEIWESWSRLACSRVRNLCLSSLTGRAGRGIRCSITPFRLGRLAACQHLGIVRHCKNWEQGQDYEKWSQIPAAAAVQQQVPEARCGDARLFDQLQIIDNKVHATHLLHITTKDMFCGKTHHSGSISLLFLHRKRVLGRGILKETVAPKKAKDTLRSLRWSSLILVFERLADGQRSDAQELLFSIC